MIGKVELALGSILALLGVRSLVLWLATRFDAQSFGELALYGLHVTSRVAIWFTLAAAFFGYALLDEPQRYQWFLFVPMFLAAVQLLTGLLLARQPVGSGGGGPDEHAWVRAGPGSPESVSAEQTPGPPGPEKRGETSEPGRPQPEAAEVERARLLVNRARDRLNRAGLTDEEIRRLADEFVAEDRGEDLGEFVEWARLRHTRAGGS